MNVRRYSAINPWNPVAVGPDLINGETFTLMFHSVVKVSNQHLCDVMVFGNDCRVLDGVGKRGVAQSSSHSEDAIYVQESVQWIVRG